MKLYDGTKVDFSRKLRRDMTPWERKLWYCFLKAYPIRFYRQRIIGKYIADFVCLKAGLVIELDGSGHYEPDQQEKDQWRTEIIENYGYKVIRFCNRDIDKNFYDVCTVIDREVKQRTLPQSPGGDSPLSDGAKASNQIQED